MKLLPSLCLDNVDIDYYVRKEREYDPFLVLEYDDIGLPKIHSKIRERKIELKTIKVEDGKINDVFLKMVDSASTLKHDLYHINNKNGLNLVASDMTRWDCAPKNLLVSSSIKIPELNNETITVHTIGHTCSSIINTCLGGVFTLDIIKFKSDKPVVFLFSIPKICGIFKYDETGIKILIKPVGCMKVEFI